MYVKVRMNVKVKGQDEVELVICQALGTRKPWHQLASTASTARYLSEYGLPAPTASQPPSHHPRGREFSL